MDAMSARTIHATGSTFDREVLRSEVPVLVDFYAGWCGPCSALAPVLERLAEEFAGRVKVVKVDVDDEPDLAERFGISGIPTLISFREGGVQETLVGFLPYRELREKLSQLAESSAPSRGGTK